MSVTQFKDLSPKEKAEDVRFSDVQKVIESIACFQFPFTTSDYSVDQVENLKASTEILIRNAENYIKFLNQILELNGKS